MTMYSEGELAERQRHYEELMRNAPKIGDAVAVTDEHGKTHNGLVSAVHGPQCINAIYLSDDENKRDPYGRQIERLSSLQEKTLFVTAPVGRFYERV